MSEPGVSRDDPARRSRIADGDMASPHGSAAERPGHHSSTRTNERARSAYLRDSSFEFKANHIWWRKSWSTDHGNDDDSEKGAA